MGYRKHTVELQDHIELFEPLQQQELTRQELAALQLLCNTEGQPIWVSDRAVVRNEVFHSLVYKRTGTSCSNIVLVEDKSRKLEFYGRVLKFLSIERQAVAIMSRFHHHSNINICKDMKDRPTSPMILKLVQERKLGTHFAAVEMIDDILAVYCKNIQSKCIFIPAGQLLEGVDGFLTQVMSDYYC